MTRILRYCDVIASPMRRSFFHAKHIPFFLIPIVTFGTSAAAAELKSGDSYPSRPVRIVVPAAAGGAVDIFARIISGGLTDAWGQPVVVDNKGGGGQTIGTEIVAKSAPD